MGASFISESNSEADTDRFGAALARTLPPGTVVALVGTLGAGKTRLVQAVGKAVGLDPHEVVSPTFVLVHEYDLPQSPSNQKSISKIFHFDAYRIKDHDEFMALGPDEYFEDCQAWTFIEWADRVSACLPREYVRIDIDVTGPDSRRLVVEAFGARYEETAHNLRSWPATLNLAAGESPWRPEP
jgi:tRNA threonylcarbamoyladenosine biosynthesis protein TsaE